GQQTVAGRSWLDLARHTSDRMPHGLASGEVGQEEVAMVMLNVPFARAAVRAAVACVVGLAACLPLPAAPAPEDCTTPGDEDGNGLADCADPACIARSAC